MKDFGIERDGRTMQEFDIKRGHLKNVEGEKLKGLVTEIFGNASESEGKVETSWGALERLTVWIDGKVLFVDTEMKQGTDDETSRITIQHYNRFMEMATGFNSKERRDRAKKKIVGKD